MSDPLDPDRALQGAVLAALRAAPALRALLGDPARIHDQPPADPVHPFVVFTRSETKPLAGAEGGLEHGLTLTCVSRFGGAEEAKAVVAAVRAVLHDADLAVDGWRLVNLRVAYGDVFRAADWRSTYGVLRLRAVTEPLEQETP